MIDAIRLRGFQVHKSRDVKLSPTVTTIIGDSDAGKSSILRALRWVCQNRPRGKQLVNHKCSRASVEVEVDGRVVRRTRSRTTKNTYRVDGRTLKAFGIEPPAEVSRLLNVGDLNFQGQRDPAFWFAKSPGEVSKELNSIVDLEVVDETLGKLAASAREASASSRVTTSRLAEAEAVVGKLAKARRAERALAAVEALEVASRDSERRAGDLAKLLSEAETLRGRVRDLSGVVDAGEAALGAGEEHAEAAGSLNRLHHDLLAGTVAERRLSTVVPSTRRLRERANGTKVAGARSRALMELVDQLSTGRSKLGANERELSKTTKEFERLTVGKVCPLCERGG